MKFLLSAMLIFSAFSVQEVQANDEEFKPSLEVCESGRKLRAAAKKAGISTRRARAICEAYELKLLEQSGKSDTDLDPGEDDDLDKLLESIGLKRNFYVTDLRRRFTLALTPGALDDEPSIPGLLGATDTWGCLAHEPWKETGGLTGSVDKNIVGISFKNIGFFNIDNSGFEYGLIEGKELIGSDQDNRKARAVRYSYYCEKGKPEDCNQDNYDTRVLYVEETVQGKGILGYLADYVDGFGIDPEEAAMQFLRNKAGQALNRVTYNECKDFRLFTGCEMVTKYYECYEDSSIMFSQFFGFNIN